MGVLKRVNIGAEINLFNGLISYELFEMIGKYGYGTITVRSNYKKQWYDFTFRKIAETMPETKNGSLKQKLKPLSYKWKN